MDVGRLHQDSDNVTRSAWSSKVHHSVPSLTNEMAVTLDVGNPQTKY